MVGVHNVTCAKSATIENASLPFTVWFSKAQMSLAGFQSVKTTEAVPEEPLTNSVFFFFFFSLFVFSFFVSTCRFLVFYFIYLSFFLPL